VLLMEFVGYGDEFVGNTVAIAALKMPPRFEGQQVIANFVAYVAGVGRGCRASHVTSPVAHQERCGLAPAVKAGSGFRSHAGHATDDGFVVTETWENAADHKVSFAASVKPNLPSERSWSKPARFVTSSSPRLPS
jgi:hypothetical protein